VPYILEAFAVDSAELASWWVLRGLSVADLQEMFAPGEDDPLMYNVYPVRPEHVPRLEKASGAKLDLARFEYFVGFVSD
jgi:hypothetical protein